MRGIVRQVSVAAALFSCAFSARADVPGATVTTLSVSGGKPWHLAAGPDGNVWYIDEMSQSVGKMAMSGGSATLTAYPIAVPAGQGSLNIARAITGGPDAVWFVFNTSRGIAYLGRITPDGNMTTTPISGTGEPASGMVVGPDGNLWYKGFGNAIIVRVTPQGVATVFRPQGQWYGSPGIVAGPDGAIWFSTNSSIGRITTEGAITEFPGGGSAMALGPDGNLWFASGNDKIGRITPTGQETLYALPEKAYTGGLATGPDGNLWFTYHYDPKFGRLVVGTATADGHAQVDVQLFDGSGSGGDVVVPRPPASGSAAPLDVGGALPLIMDYVDPTRGGPIVKVEVVPPQPDLVVYLSHNSFDANEAGTRLTYVIDVVNEGTGPTTETAYVSDVLPQPLTLDQEEMRQMYPHGGYTYDPPTRRVTFTIPPRIERSFSRVVFVAVRVPQSFVTGEITNRATATVANEGDPSDNESSPDVIDVDAVQVVATKQAVVDSDIGFTGWEIRVHNYGIKPVSRVTVTDDLGSAAGNVTATGSATCTVSGSTATCEVATLAPGTEALIRLYPRNAPAEGTTNVASVSGPATLRASGTFARRQVVPAAFELPTNVANR